MHKRIWLLMLLAILLVAGTANAITQITISGGDDGSVQFTGTGAGATVSLLGSANCTSGIGLFGSTVGSYQLSFAGATTLSLTGGSGVSSYGVSAPLGTVVNFSFTIASGPGVVGGTLMGTFSFDTLTGAGNQIPSLTGTFTVGSVTPGSTLAGYWNPGDTSAAQFAIDLGKNSTVNTIAGNNGASTAGTPASGDVPVTQTPPSPVPEPASILMLGSGLLALGGTIKRRYFR
jgi:hypothetical protein